MTYEAKICAMVRKALKKQDKKKVLEIWNKVYREWFGNNDKFFMTKEDFHSMCGCDGRKLSKAKIWDRSLAGYDAKKGYVILWKDGYVESVSKFYSKDFVNLSSGFLCTVYEYSESFGLYGVFDN